MTMPELMIFFICSRIFFSTFDHFHAPSPVFHKNKPYFEGANKATMPEFAEWVAECEKVLTF